MSITAKLKDFSLPEILQLIEQGKRTGLLMLCAPPDIEVMSLPVHYIWVDRGRIVAAANQLDHQGLISLIAQRCWDSERVLAKLIQWCCPSDKPLGLCLKEQGVLQTQQLKQLFQLQVLQPVNALFQLRDGHFRFDQNVPLPGREMTGLSIWATEATLLRVRFLHNSKNLAEQLPSPHEDLVSATLLTVA